MGMNPIIGVVVCLIGAAAGSSSAMGCSYASKSQDVRLVPSGLALGTVHMVPNGQDLGTQLNNLFAARPCSLKCTVVLPPGDFDYAQTIVIPTGVVSLVGSGSTQTRLNYRGTGDGIYWRKGVSAFGEKAGALKGFTLTCGPTVSSPLAPPQCKNGIHAGNYNGTTWEDLAIYGATAGNGILLENGDGTCGASQADFTERTYMRNIWLGWPGPNPESHGNLVGLHLARAPKADCKDHGLDGTDSFGYSDMQLWINLGEGQTGVKVDPYIRFYHSNLDIKGNVGAHGMVMDVAGEFTGNLNVMAEGGLTSSVWVRSTGLVKANGSVRVAAYSSDPLTQATGYMTVPVVEPGGFYAVGPLVSLDSTGSAIADPSTGAEARLGPPTIQTAQKKLLAGDDGSTIVVARSNTVMMGRLILQWPATPQRHAVMIMDVACAHYAENCALSIPVDWAYQQFHPAPDQWGPMFRNPTIRRTPDGDMQLELDVGNFGNLNGAIPSLIATWYGVPDTQISLFPGVVAIGHSGAQGNPSLRGTVLADDSGAMKKGAAVCVKSPGPPLVLGPCPTQ